jgi:hypothetical protein
MRSAEICLIIWTTALSPLAASTSPAPVSANPGYGSGGSQTFAFTFFDSSGFQSLGVQNVLINNYLDGRHACFLAFVPSGPSAGSVFLIDDRGDAGGPYQGLVLPGSQTVQNSQCAISGAGSTVVSSGDTITVTLAVTFSQTFAGNKVIYMAAQDTSSLNSGWQALGTFNVPGATPSGPAVGGVSPARTSALSQTYAFTFTDTNGFADLSVLNVLVNSSIDGRAACYLAFQPSGVSGGSLYLVDDAGDAGGPYSGMVIPGSGTVSNSQCSIAGSGSAVTVGGSTLTLTLALTFSQSFAGNRVLYLAARSNTLNSDWQSSGSVTVGLSYNQTILLDHPAAFWDINPRSGAEPDLSGNGNSGTYQGGSPSVAAMPNGDQAAVFNGSTQYLTIPSKPSLSIPTTGSLTWEMWIDPSVLQFPNSSSDGFVEVMGKCANFSPTCEWESRLYNTTNSQDRCNRLSAYVYNPTAGLGSGAFWQPVCGLLQAGQWIHVVGEYSTLSQPSDCPEAPAYPGSIDIWVNGVKWNQSVHNPTGCMSQYGVAPQANNSPLNIGTMARDTWFEGAIGKVAIYNYELSQEQIASHYRAMTGRTPTGICTSVCSF